MNATDNTSREFRTAVRKLILFLPAVILVFIGGGALAEDAWGEHDAPGNQRPNAFTQRVMTPADTGEGSAGVRQMESALDRQLSAVSNVVFHEQIARYSRKGKITSQRDTLDANVEVIDGIEKYSSVQRKHKVFADMRDLPGTWSVGEVATLLRVSRDAVRLGTIQIGPDEPAGLCQALAITFAYSTSSRHWYLKVNERVYWMAFTGQVWTSSKTGDLARISWHARDLPAESGISEVLWTVDFRPVDVSSLAVNLPRETVYRITYEPGQDRVDWNVTHFSAYRRYGTNTRIHFDE